ncbi:mitochondrial import receptor subunit TOM70 [Bactrocera dorsalis]|uniref:Mitochondrial import receptor subunit TOM70 n=1 Tax=Bactrocera dorsalis TaxID=27457 RepID=A0ABM3J037_BACDO|nr:mitochondrial import receptor subunit TOM70 [Bactrocera dorsalis]XP_049302595.1 mitochondrial import receptor subunit TOM70 [Bactrocera dorsalis]XP_049302596.1 mitochondrial import receptor subunit TOM70 [Bactrocera dorsalis]XP_049302597.1 mitochondrial import receptor subunit TOM70 [Bactrocera dorsalis]
MAYRYGSISLTRWQLALLIGTPVAIGLGVYIYRKSVEEKKPIGDNDADRKKGLSTKDKQKTLSIDGTNEDKELERKKKDVELESEKLSPLKEATMYKNEGNVCYRNGKYDEAISFYDKAIDKCPIENRTDLAIFYQNRAASYEMLKKWNRVKEDCSRSLEFNPQYAKAYYRRAKAHEATNDLMECLDDVTATCILEMFQNNSTIMYADRILKQTGREDTERGLKEHVPVLPSSNFIQTYLRSFVADPLVGVSIADAKEGAELKGFARAKKALDEMKYEDVISACTEEIETSESESQYKSEALLLRGTFYLLSGGFNASQQDFDAVINNADADVALRATALIKRASLHIQKEEKDLGLADFDAAAKLQPDNPDIYHQRAQIYILLDQLPEALSEFEKVVKLSPNHAMAYIQKCYAEYRMALLSQDQMRLMIVMNEFKNAIEKFPDCIECYSLMAQVLADQQQFQQADQFYEKALKVAPENASLYVHRGVMLLQWKGDIDKAITLINQALEVDNKCLLAYETLGTIEVQRANLNRAVELFEKAIKLSKSKSEMGHLYALRNAAVAQLNVTRKLGIDMSKISALAQQGMMPAAV